MAEMSYYDLLDVPIQASTDEIKRAYYRKIRVFTNEEHPEEFMELRKAYETLSDAVSRKRYDAVLFADPESIAALEEIESSMEKEDYEKAIRLIKKEMLRNGPSEDLIAKRVLCEYRTENYSAALNQLSLLELDTQEDKEFFYFYSALSYMETGNAWEAEKSATKLLEVNPEPVHYQRVYANTLYRQDKFNDVKNFYNRLVRETALNIEHVHMLLDYITLEGIVDISANEKRRLKYAILSLPKSERERESILSQMIDYIHEQDYITLGHVKDICDLAEQMNDGRHGYIDDAIRDLRSSVAEQEHEQEHEGERGQRRQEAARQTPVYESAPREVYHAPVPVKDRGNILIAIILGIILSGPLSPVGGIAAGAIYYYFARAIWNLIGCLFLIVIIVALIGMFFG
ncbi:J domain-containing protein [Sporosarcina sp. 179-K 3D1 HS]|uniref:J domain-containing protein n=1 Tax=Sporosarcina sp. 179-K 3D1 HS TaxID=3232169 RepID=UPI00399FE84F